MPFGYQTAATAIVNALTNANTSTAAVNLSGGLSTTVSTIIVNDPEIIAIRKLDFPAVIIRVNRMSTEFTEMGVDSSGYSTRDRTVNYDIFAMYMREGMHTDHSTGVAALYRLAQNIEGVLEREQTLSNTALWCRPVSTQFADLPGQGGVSFKIARIDLEARYFHR